MVVVGFFVLLAVGIFTLAGICLGQQNKQSNQDFLRLHIRANSNDPADQSVKHLVRQGIVDELTPLFYDVVSKKDAMLRLRDNLEFIEGIANTVLYTNGFSYTAKAGIKSEHFPTRSYTTTEFSLALPEGIYDALILQLGEGTGDNWWCVIYPPLCFMENSVDSIRYQFKLLEWFKKQ